ncbi:hypothetical protein GTS_49710 [Gandjariella thermophila]|uniref:Uncharacterized protein n=1 Tax=Gandjariella thermophila TaxID=1931992 RepID=A0A4D4JFA7_9PSEU|nr:hypothetical protein GTS_49710 [Gandjariella thermophila]
MLTSANQRFAGTVPALPPNGARMTAAAAPGPGTGRWMPGLFRPLQHWIPPGARWHYSPIGPAYYAAPPCYSPCVSRPDIAHLWTQWRRCPVCTQAGAQSTPDSGSRHDTPASS